MKISQPAAITFSKQFFLALALLAGLSAGHLVRAADAAAGISDAEIRAVVLRVARHQIHPLADGEYPAVTNLAAAKSAKCCGHTTIAPRHVPVTAR